MHVRQDLFLHIIIAVLKLKQQRAFAVAIVYKTGCALHKLLALREPCHVVIAYYVYGLCLLNIALHVLKVEEALVAFGMLRPLKCGQQRVKLLEHMRGVHHLVLGRARVYVPAAHGYSGGRGVEVFVFYLAYRAAVHGVGKIGAEALNVKHGRAVADLLIGGKGDAELAVRLVFRDDGLHGGENFRDAGLVVRA